ncbi:hypothetical protein WJX72_006960 [[Myrmecia] bisecta]|uniref:CS domain-containing protein n=1 Tax=[Myrmecia] bisecta TaxID=41462 RepID=A0AAW1PNP3_9CHLO
MKLQQQRQQERDVRIAPQSQQPQRGAGNVLTLGNLHYVEDSVAYHTCLLEALDVSSIDAVLVSSPQAMLALPYITRQPGFEGQVLATEATLTIAGHLLWELLEAEAANGSAQLHLPSTAGREGTTWLSKEAFPLLPTSVQHALLGSEPQLWPLERRRWRTLYSKAEAHACLASIQGVRYGQQVSLGGGAMEATAVPSGHEVGGAVWKLQAGQTRVGYLAAASQLAGPQAPLNPQDLMDLDALILAPVTDLNDPGQDGDGLAFEILEQVGKALKTAGLAHIPMFYISPAAEDSLAHGTVGMEWLCSERQERVYLPMAPFGHAELLQEKRLMVASSLADLELQSWWREPCVALVPASSLRSGAATQLLWKWGSEARNVVVFTQQGIARRALAPFGPLKLAVVEAPLRAPLSPAELASLLAGGRLTHLLLPETLSNDLAQVALDEQQSLASEPITTYGPLETVHVSLPHSSHPALMTAELAAQVDLQPVEGIRGVAAGRVWSLLSLTDGRWQLDPVPTGISGLSGCGMATLQSLQQPTFLWGQASVQQVLDALHERGMYAIETLTEVNIYCKVPQGVKAKQLYVDIDSKHLRVGIQPNPPYLNRDFAGKVKASDSFWTLEDGELHLTISKAEEGEPWKSALEGHEIDPLQQQAEQKRLMLERFQEEHPGFDFSGAEFSGEAPNPRTFMGGMPRS